MSRMGFEPTTFVFERAKTVQALDREANLISNRILIFRVFHSVITNGALKCPGVRVFCLHVSVKWI
jgi:hypothetical protein